MADVCITGVAELGLLGKGSDLLEAAIHQQDGIFICEMSWPKASDVPFMETLGQFVHKDDSQRPGDPLRYVTFRLPKDVGNVVTADAWFRTHLGRVQLLPATWTLSTPSGEGICMRQPMDEPVVIFTKAGEDDWEGEADLGSFLDALNDSPLCQPETAVYIEGSVEVTLSAAGQEQDQLSCFQQLAGLYK